MADLLEPKELLVTDLNGNERKYVMSKFPAIAGREIVAGYPLTAVPKLAEYSTNEAIMLKVMCYVAVEVAGGNQIKLVTKDLVNNHVPDWETLARIEYAMLSYNTSFLGRGEILNFSSAIVKRVLASISPTLISLSERLSQAGKQRSAN